ncbi:MAG: response regulator [Deltaproteobacteria bacterium]|nr:response regulator [Deltaproteobacteria bacterium]
MDRADREGRIRAQIVDGIYRQAPGGMVATLANALILAAVLLGEVQAVAVGTWLAAVILLLVARAALVLFYRRSSPPPELARVWERRFMVGLFLSGLLWGSTAVFLFPVNAPLHQAFLAIVLCGMAAGAVGSFFFLVEMFALFTFPALTPLIVRFLLIPGGVYLALAAMTALFVALTVATARRTSRANWERVELKETFADMLEDRTSELTRSNRRLRAENEERRRAEKALAETEKRYRNLFDNIPDLLYAHDLEGRMLEANRSWERYGFNRDDLVGLSARRILSEQVKGEFDDYLARILEDGFTEGLMQIRGKDGGTFTVEYRSDLVRDDEDRPVAVRGAGRDVTDRIQAHKEKRELEAQLMQAQRLKAIGTLAGGIAHNFNNLLMGIQGNVSLGVLEIDAGHPLEQRLARIDRLVGRGSELTSHLLAYAREGKVQVRPLDINEVVKNTASAFGETRKEMRVHLDLAEGLGLVEADLSQIRQAVLNLCINAAEAMPGGGELRIRTRGRRGDEVREARPDAKHCDYVKMTILDTGVGMDQETMARVFDPFFTTKGVGQGTGLGLASVHGIVESHGGLIEVDSEVGRGTRFDVYLPVAVGRGREGKLMEEQTKHGPRTVLLVDDEPIIVEVGEQMLGSLGFRVFTAGSGREALKVYERYAGEIDLVVLDMIMPDMSGGETFDRLKEADPGVRVLLSSGYSIDGEAREILDRGCSGFIQKPFRLSDLSDVLDELMAGGETDSQA